MISCRATTAVLAAILAAAGIAPPAVAQQPCNPVIDGTYCASQMNRASGSSRSSTSFQPIEGIAGDVLFEQSQPATLGAITFQGNGSRCIGLLRRSNCS